MAHKTKEQISYNMSQVYCTDSVLERTFADELNHRGIATYREFWLPKIERNIKRDKEAFDKLIAEGWTVLRFWEHRMKKSLTECVDEIITALRIPMSHVPLRTINLYAGTGGICRRFELTKIFRNILLAVKVSGYLESLKRYFERQEGRGNGLRYNVINGDEILWLVANNGNDLSFSEGIPKTQQYIQFGNSVMILAIEEIAEFIEERFKNTLSRCRLGGDQYD